MKKLKLLNILLVIVFLFSLPVVHAHEVDVKNQAISIEQSDGTISSKSKILVDLAKLGLDEDTQYILSYQYVLLENGTYNKYLEIYEDQQKYIASYLEENNYQSVDDIPKNKVSEFNEGVMSYVNQIESLLPTFAESNWINAEDATAILDETKIPDNELGKQPYVLWMRVKTNDASYYGTKVITVNVPTKEETKDESKEESPKTGDEIIWIVFGGLAISGLMVASYKKINA